MTLFEFDNAIMAETGAGWLCGVDEAGRGPLAGSVYAAAVVLPPGCVIEGLDDSKKISEKKRERLYDDITDSATYWKVASASVEEIEEHNILKAAMLAMRRAVMDIAVSKVNGLALVDGNADPKPGFSCRTVISGDAKSACIAAASVLAKVSRDRYMLELDDLYPQYGFAAHKGYGTKLHYEMLDKYGPCPVHRESFLKKWRAAQPVL